MADQPDLLTLANGRRDTIYYGAAAAWCTKVAITSAINTGIIYSVTMTPLLVLLLIAGREAVRRISWGVLPPQQAQFEGQNAPQINVPQCKAAIGTVLYGSLASIFTLAFPITDLNGLPRREMPNGHAFILPGIFGSLTLYEAVRAGGIGNVRQLYKKIIFDLPRKRGDNGDGGTPELQLWKNAAIDFFGIRSARPLRPVRIVAAETCKISQVAAVSR